MKRAVRFSSLSSCVLLIAMAFAQYTVVSEASAKTSASSASDLSPLQENLLVPFDGGESAQNLVRERLTSLSKDEALKFVASVESSAKSLAGDSDIQGRVLRSLDVLRRRADFDAAAALKILKSFESFEKSGSKSRLEILLLAKAGTLTQKRVDQEFKQITSKELPSEIRLSLVGALTDAMGDAGLVPTISQYESLLRSDVASIRIHAVQWFGISPLESLNDRVRFFKLALSNKPYQARLIAYRLIAQFKPADIRALEKAGGFNRSACTKESAAPFSDICRAIDSKSGDKP